MNKQPTDAQWREILEWCGFKHQDYLPSFGSIPETPELYFYPNGLQETELPPIDLNNLFLYVVPKFGYRIRAITIYPPITDPPVCDKCYIEITLCDGQTVEAIEDTHALALFWAIWNFMSDLVKPGSTRD